MSKLLSKEELAIIRALAESSEDATELKLLAHIEAQAEEIAKLQKISELKTRAIQGSRFCGDHQGKQYDKPCQACEVERLESQFGRALATKDAEIARLKGRIEKLRSGLKR